MIIMSLNREHSRRKCIKSHKLERNTDISDNYSKESYKGHIPITPQMIRAAIKRLQLRKVYVDSKFIGEYLRHCYPVQLNVEALNAELNEKLHCAVNAGLIVKHGENTYCLPTLRQEANLKTMFAEFWKIYKNVIQNRTCDSRKKNLTRKHSSLWNNQRYNVDSSEDNESFSSEDFRKAKTYLHRKH